MLQGTPYLNRKGVPSILYTLNIVTTQLYIHE